MSLLIGLGAVVSLLFASLTVAIVLKVKKSARDEVPWSMQEGAHVLAIVTNVHVSGEWREGNRWVRSPWTGDLVKDKTWQTSYDVELRFKLWSNNVARPPKSGQTIVLLVVPRHPGYFAVDVRSFS